MLSINELYLAYQRLGSIAAASDSRAPYRLIDQAGECFVAVSPIGRPTLLVPLQSEPTGIARVASGCTLHPAATVEFDFNGEVWSQPAAVVECTATDYMRAFAVLALDLSDRLQAPSWGTVATLFDEWCELLGRSRRLTRDEEIGLWGELWCLTRTSPIDLLCKAWCASEIGRADFALDGMSLEVKTSTTRLRHYVSHQQIGDPPTETRGYLLSLWIGVDPVRGASLPELIAKVLSRSEDPAAAAKRVLRAGYSMADEAAYVTKFLLLDVPLFFQTADVPMVRAVDGGVSELRYCVTLDPARAIGDRDLAQVLETLAFNGAVEWWLS